MSVNIGNKKSKIYIGSTKVSKVYLGSRKIYSSGSTCTYICDGNTYQEEVDEGASCLSPKTVTPAKDGWEFAGWRQDTEANGNVLSSLTMGDAPITLYAVFRQTITLSYNGNSATSGSTAAQTGYRYYNNGNVANPSFTLRSNGFSRSGYTFSKWALNSASGTQYAVGASMTLAASTTMYAVWVAAAFTLELNASDWSGPFISGPGFKSGPQIINNPYGTGGVTVEGVGKGSTAYSIGGFRKVIDTKGFPKADITVTNTNGSVSIGGSTYDFYGKAANQTVTLSLSSAASQTLQIYVNCGGDNYNWKDITVTRIYFHS